MDLIYVSAALTTLRNRPCDLKWVSFKDCEFFGSEKKRIVLGFAGNGVKMKTRRVVKTSCNYHSVTSRNEMYELQKRLA